MNDLIVIEELCKNNCFSDSEEDSSDSDEEECIIKKQPDDTNTDKITIIVDGFYNNKVEEKYDDWENIEFAELGDVINDPSSNTFINKKKL
jgi:hypothetical protein